MQETPSEFQTIALRYARSEYHIKAKTIQKIIASTLRNITKLKQDSVAQTSSVIAQRLKKQRQNLSIALKELKSLKKIQFRALRACSAYQNEAIEKHSSRETQFRRMMIEFLIESRVKEQADSQSLLDTTESITALRTQMKAEYNAIRDDLACQRIKSLTVWVTKNKPHLVLLENTAYECVVKASPQGCLRDFLNFQVAIRQMNSYLLEKSQSIIHQVMRELICGEDNLLPGRIITQMKREFFDAAYALYGLTAQNTLEESVVLGLMTLKTQACSVPSQRKFNCPTCDPSLGDMAKKLPNLHYRTQLVCRINGSSITQSEGRVLPNGQIYSVSGLESTAKGNNFVCHATGSLFPKADCKTVYLS